MPIAETVQLLVIAFGIFTFTLFVYFAIVSYRENETIATRWALLLTVLLPLPYLAAGLLRFAEQTQGALALIAITILAGLVLFFPFDRRKIIGDDTPKKRIDERDIVFARNRLKPGTERFEEYYQRNPDKKALDDQFRAKPGLLSPNATYFDPLAFAAADASFATVAAFRPLLDRELHPIEQVAVKPGKMSTFIKKWGEKLGAVSVGITELKDYHLYSRIGRGEPYAAPVELNHIFAIAVTVEMDKLMLDSAPYAPTVMESAQQYLNAGAIAVQIAEFIHALGYPARAHIDGNYRVICPLVARDAGLGEIGRMGLLITPKLGPRVRIAVVTTDLPLIADKRIRDYSVIDFCRRCKKCADTCPSKAISFDDRTDIDGAMRWRINSEACFTYWCAVGTDCGRCMRICPYSHPNNTIHNMVRLGVRISPIFRQFALKMDDFFYGRKPAPSPVPEWIKSVPQETTN